MMATRELQETISHNLIRPRLAELGKIKIGGKGEEREKSGGGTFRLPEKYDHFVVTGRERGEDGNYVRDEAIHERIGSEEPTELKVRLLFDRPSDNFFSRMVQYSGRQKVWECDGDTARNLKSDKTGACQHPECKCKPFGRLQVVLEAAPRLGGFHVFRTTSWESVQAIQTSLEQFHEMFGGRLRGLPLILKLYPSTDRYEDGQGNVRESTSYKVTLLLDGGFEEARRALQEVHEHRLLEPEEQRRLAADVRERLSERDEAEETEIGEEYFPDPNEVTSARTKETIEEIKEENGLSQPEEEEGEDGESEPRVTSEQDVEEELRKRGHWIGLIEMAVSDGEVEEEGFWEACEKLFGGSDDVKRAPNGRVVWRELDTRRLRNLAIELGLLEERNGELPL